MSRSLYSLLMYLSVPLILLKLKLRGKKNPAYRQRWRERFGFIKSLPGDKPVIWVHAVSVGETIASAPMVKALMAKYPNHQLVVTTMTPTGSERVISLYGDSVQHVYFPYDLPDAQRRFIKRIRPKAAILVETELWPNMIALCNKSDIPVMVVNARLSERSARGYRKLGCLTRNMMVGIDQVACQSEIDGERFVELGLDREKLTVTGSFKFDLTLSDDIPKRADELRSQWEKGLDRNVKIFTAASTHEGEESQILEAFRQIIESAPDTLLLLVPRHAERFQVVYRMAVDAGFDVALRSDLSSVIAGTQVIIGDTMGEMMTYYAASDLALVGGSLIDHGGHNVLEPAALGLPVISGPSIFNFMDISTNLSNAGGLQIVEPDNIARCVLELLRDKDRANAMGVCARGFVEANRGALEKLMQLLEKQL